MLLEVSHLIIKSKSLQSLSRAWKTYLFLWPCLQPSLSPSLCSHHPASCCSSKTPRHLTSGLCISCPVWLDHFSFPDLRKPFLKSLLKHCPTEDVLPKHAIWNTTFPQPFFLCPLSMLSNFILGPYYHVTWHIFIISLSYQNISSSGLDLFLLTILPQYLGQCLGYSKCSISICGMNYSSPTHACMLLCICISM